jgi:hypothetical protein
LAVAIVVVIFLLRSPSAPQSADNAKLAGRWLRPDGDYILEIRSVHKEGRLEAAYFNPRPINVSRAEWQNAETGLEVFIELQDVNYPGCTYRLRYLTDRDMLVGVYYQAALGERYDVEFTRITP